MAFSPIDADPAAVRIAQYYADAEIAIIRKMVLMLAQGIDSPDWDREQLAALQRLRDMAVRELGGTDAAAAIFQEVENAYQGGVASALKDMAPALDPSDALLSEAGKAQVANLAGAAVGTIESAKPMLLRAVADVFREVVADVTAQTILGTITRKQAYQIAANRFLGQGLPTFKDSRGRNWRIQDYARMAVRTATAKTAIQAHLDTAEANGFDLVMITAGPRHCKVCDGWTGKVLHRDSGPEGTYVVESLVTGRPVQVKVEGSLADARRAGWGHPNCRCNIRVFIPGATKVEARPPWDQAAYEAQQRQRALENQVRMAKLKQAVAVTPEAEARAKGQLKDAFARLNQHMQDHDYLKRQRQREQV